MKILLIAVIFSIMHTHSRCMAFWQPCVYWC